MLSKNPIILTLEINQEAAIYFTDLRKKYFPAERNFLDAHLTLFHNLPGNENQILEDLEIVCNFQKPITLQVSQVVNTGAGTAFKIESSELKQLHKNLQQKWQAWIIPQDKQTLWPHITIQNKVDHQLALQLKQELEINFEPFEIQGSGLSLWEYLGGPWNFLQTLKFNG